MAQLAEGRAQKALRRANRLAERAGVSAVAELRNGRSASRVLLNQAKHHDLLVVGSRGNSRAQGILLGSVASKAAHTSETALLVARSSADREAFPERLLLASDGSAGSWAAARTASRIARARGSQVEIVYVPDRMDAGRQRTVSRQALEIRDAIGVEPAFAEAPGHVARRIVEAAESAKSSLVVVGKRGLKGPRALGSVSERVVHQARCSVLVVPPRTRR
jgi:nucleotide-binding universal stress UspA family protein